MIEYLYQSRSYRILDVSKKQKELEYKRHLVLIDLQLPEAVMGH